MDHNIQIARRVCEFIFKSKRRTLPAFKNSINCATSTTPLDSASITKYHGDRSESGASGIGREKTTGNEAIYQSEKKKKVFGGNLPAYLIHFRFIISLFSFRGTVLIRALPQMVISGLLTWSGMYVYDSIHVTLPSASFPAIATVTSFLLVFRTQVLWYCMGSYS